MRPAGGNPAAITSLPGVGGALGAVGGRLAAATAELPGRSARFGTGPLTAPLLVTGAPRVRVTVSGVPDQPGGDAVLFGRLFEESPDGTRTLLGRSVAPFRTAVPATVELTLPAVVAPIETGHRLVVSVATTDQGYAVDTAPAAWRIGVDGPVVPGRASAASTVPLGPAVGLVAVLAALLGAVGGAVLAAIVSQILNQITALEGLRDHLPTRFGTAWADLLAADVDWGDMTRGLFSAAVYAAVFGALAVWRFARADITS